MDEIKVFRGQSEDENDSPSLADDKKDVALEEEMENRPEKSPVLPSLMDEDGDEIKVFRVHNEDESDAPSLADDKKDVALEEEMESGSAGRSAFHPITTPLSSMATPQPFFNPAAFNPFQLALQQWQMNQAMIANAAANVFAASLSPRFASPLPQPASPLDLFSRTMAALSPLAGPRVGRMGGPMGAFPLATPSFNPFAQMQFMGLSGMGYGGGMNPSTSTQAPPPSTTTAKRKRGKDEESEDKKEHIKKPKNAYFCFMKENRERLKNEEEWKDKQSTDVNTELGKRWQGMTEEEKKPYYDMYEKDKAEHTKMYPDWSAKQNYAIRAKNKTKKDRATDPAKGKKCRARFGLDNTQKWCKNCGLKKKCQLNEKEEDEAKEERENHQTASDSESDLDDEPTASLSDEQLKLKMQLDPTDFK